MLPRVILGPLLPVGCLEVVEVVFSGGLTSVGRFEGRRGAGVPSVGALVRLPPLSHLLALGVTSEITPGLPFVGSLGFDLWSSGFCGQCFFFAPWYFSQVGSVIFGGGG